MVEAFCVLMDSAKVSVLVGMVRWTSCARFWCTDVVVVTLELRRDFG